MSGTQIFKLPDLGEGLTESEVLNWKVEVGQRVELNQVLAEVETAKAVVELPSPYAGVVRELHAEPGQVVPVGGVLVTFGEAGSDDADRPADGRQSGQAGRTPTLVGYGAEPASGARPARRTRRGVPAGAGAQSTHSTGDASGQGAPSAQAPDRQPGRRSHVPRSTPPVRKFAREHGVDLAGVGGTGRDGLIVRADVQAALEGTAPAPQAAASGGERERQPEDRVVKISAVRRATAKAMVESAFTAPHATEFLTVDVTASLDLIEALRAHPALRHRHVNITTLLALVCCRLLQAHRRINSSWDGDNDQIIEHGAVNLGMAVSTERGLLVPVIRQAERLGLGQLADELAGVIEQGRAGTLSPHQLVGGSFSITNVGVFGVDAGTPILPPGQAAILAVGQVKRRPWEYRDELALRHTTTLALAFDHRVIDGKEGSQFLADVGQVLENPGLISLFI